MFNFVRVILVFPEGLLLLWINVKGEIPYKDNLLKVPDAVKVDAIVPGEEIDIPIAFIFFKNSDSAWKIYDIHLDGRSVIFSYKKQFSSIISKHGAAYFLKKLKDLVAKGEK